ncbi:MAG: hypothetical protein HY437_01020 [Candidatus Magasanikbacteria bacterium]|nr:hypothetical protein [Candidatus Magasanikbacteria bacterium]
MITLSRNISPEGNNVSCRNVIIIARYLQKTIGTESWLFRDLPYDRAYLIDEVHWIPLVVYTTIINRAKTILNDPDAAYHIGFSSAELESWGDTFKYLQRLFASITLGPKDVYRRLPEYVKHFNQTKDFALIETADTHALMNVTFKPGINPWDDVESDRFIQGILASIPTVWHLPPATVTTVASPYHTPPDPSFLYRITWERPRGLGERIKLLVRNLFTARRTYIENTDHQLALLRRYTEGLEAIVDERTRELTEAKNELERWRQKAQDLLYGLLPKRIAETMVQKTLPPQRIYATAMFTDLAGFTAYSRDRTPDEVARELNVYFDHMKDIVLAHGGWIVKFLGDGIHIIFGIENEPDHEQCAARAALAMQEVMARYPWQMRIGIHAGEMILGEIGSGALRRLDATGHTLNLAARLQGVAEKGQVVMSETFAEKIKNRFESDAHGTADLKGIGEIPIYRLIRER